MILETQDLLGLEKKAKVKEGIKFEHESSKKCKEIFWALFY